ncbi:MAG TPA: hypothetical protein VF721_07675, partial [Pyrinomonadaceae bacterium]
ASFTAWSSNKEDKKGVLTSFLSGLNLEITSLSRQRKDVKTPFYFILRPDHAVNDVVINFLSTIQLRHYQKAN